MNPTDPPRDDSNVLAEVDRDPDFVRRALFDETFSQWDLLFRLAKFLISVDSNSLSAHLFLARALRGLGQTGEAREALSHCDRLILENLVPLVEAESLRAVVERERALVGTG